jgi:hypothetical protein
MLYAPLRRVPAAFALVALVACADDEGVKAVEGFRTDGMVAMNAPIRLPRTPSGRDETVVWLRLPEGAHATAEWLDDQGRYALRFPAGTMAARVESWSGVVADVRGTRLEPEGRERFFVLRPSRSGSGLTGIEWSRGRRDAQRRATARLAALAPDEPAARHLARQNECASCHAHARAANARPNEHGALNRATDANGFFAIESVLEDEAPLESYRPVDPNVGDPYVEVRCGDAAAEVVSGPGESRPRCRDARVPHARYDLARALAAGDPHATEVCDSRRALFAWADSSARAAFAGAFGECGISSR